MTPQEKAFELIQEFGILGMQFEQTDYTSLNFEDAKKCAKIVAKTILNEPKMKFCGGGILDEHYTFWREVLTEIENMKL